MIIKAAKFSLLMLLFVFCCFICVQIINVDKGNSRNGGFYCGHLNIVIKDNESRYYLELEGKSKLGWYGLPPTNFCYQILNVVFRDDNHSEHHVSVDLANMTYRSAGSNGILNREILAVWLYGGNLKSADNGQVDFVLELFEGARRGCLLPPNHHPYYINDPIDVEVWHFLLGRNVSIDSTIFAWLLLWFLLTAIYVIKSIKKKHSHPISR